MLTRFTGATLPSTASLLHHTVRVSVPTLTVAETLGRLGENPSSLMIVVNVALDRLQVMQRLDHGGLEVIEPHPAWCRNG